MTVIIAEGWRTYGDRTELGNGWSLAASTVAGTVFTDVSGRRTLDMYGARLARPFPDQRKVCAHFVLDLTAGTIASGITLFSFGLNPAAAPSSAWTASDNERFQVRAVGPNLVVVRRAFGPDGALVAVTQTVASVPHGMAAGASYRIEIKLDVGEATGRAQVLVNGAMLVDAEFPRAFSGYENDAPFGVLSLHAQGTTGARGRISNFVLYSDDGATHWPVGPVNLTYLSAQPNPGETISAPPALTDPEIPVDSATGKTWTLADISAVSAVLGVVGSVRLTAPNALAPALADVVWASGGAPVRTDSYVIQPGVPVADAQVLVPVSDAAGLNSLTLTVRPTPKP